MHHQLVFENKHEAYKKHNCHNSNSDKKKSKEFLENVESKLDSQIFGHKIAKNKIVPIIPTAKSISPVIKVINIYFCLGVNVSIISK